MTTHYFGSHNGGVEIVAERLFQEFAAAGHEVVWIAGDSTPPPNPIDASHAIPIKVVNVVEKKMGLPFPLPTMGGLRTIEAEIAKADILLLHDCLYLSNIAGFRNAQRCGIPTIIVQHIGFVPYRNPILNTLMKIANALVARTMLHRASQVVFVSDTTRRFFSDVRFQRSPETIFNGVDTELYRPARTIAEVTELRKRYELPLDRPVILFVGRFVEKKGLAILRQTVAMKPDYAWAFAGWGPLDPREWNAPNAYVFSGLRGESMADLYRACDLFFLPSVGEGFPLVVQEALASGLPVVCGIETISADPELAAFAVGVAFGSEKSGHAAAACIEAIDRTFDSELCAARARRRREFAVHRYSWLETANRYLALAAGLLTQSTTESLDMGGNDT